MQILYTYRLSNEYKENNNLIRQIINLLDEIILVNKDEIHILSRKGLRLLDKKCFEHNLYYIFLNPKEFMDTQILYYVLIKSIYLNMTNSRHINNMILKFITKSLIYYIGKDKTKFMYVITELPLLNVFNNVLEELWNNYTPELMQLILQFHVFPYIGLNILDYRKICSHCNKLTKVNFVRCYKCRLIHYCSNFCQYKHNKSHKKTCLNLFN